MALLSLTPLLLLALLCLYARLRGHDVYAALLEGAEKGLRLTLDLSPALVLLFALIVWMILSFRELDKAAAWLLLPYLLWTAFAGYLNLGVWVLNK